MVDYVFVVEGLGVVFMDVFVVFGVDWVGVF